MLTGAQIAAMLGAGVLSVEERSRGISPDNIMGGLLVLFG